MQEQRTALKIQTVETLPAENNNGYQKRLISQALSTPGLLE